MGNIWAPLAKAIAATGTDRHVDCLIDLIGADIAHDLVTVTRYSATKTPEFVKHRRFSDEMVRRYLDSYYVFDPFYASWRRERRLGIMPLKRTGRRGGQARPVHSRIPGAVGDLRRGRHHARLMAATGASASSSTARLCRSGTARSPLLSERLPVFVALHALDIKARGPDFSRTSAPTGPGASPQQKPTHSGEPVARAVACASASWCSLILAGHPTANIAARSRHHRRHGQEPPPPHL